MEECLLASLSGCIAGPTCQARLVSIGYEQAASDA